MASRVAPGLVGGCVLVVCALLACKKMSVEAKATGYKPGSNTVVIVHVKSGKNTRVTCASGGLECEAADTNYAGETDMEVDLEGANASKKDKVVIFEVSAGSHVATAKVDLAASGLPPKVDVNDTGAIACVARKCEGTLTVAPAGRLELDVESGTVAEVGSESFTSQGGKIDSPVTIATTPPLKELPLSTLCAKEPRPLGSTTLTLTFPDKVKVSGTIELSSERVAKPLKSALEAIDKGPVLFQWESAGHATIPAARRTALYVATVACSAAGPSNATLADVAVVVVSASETRHDTCTYHLTEKSSGSSRGTSTGNLTLYDENATAYNRVTGAKLGSRLFKAAKLCSSDIDLSGTTAIPEQYAFVDAPAVAAWARSLAR